MRWPIIALAGGLLVVILIVVGASAFYVEENWRGARAWNETQARLSASGENLHWEKLIPAPIPDDQNLGALDLFQLDPSPEDNGALEPLALKRAFKSISNGYSLPIAGRWMVGRNADLKDLQENLSAHYREVVAPGLDAPPMSALDELDALCPALNEICAAASVRPFCRFNQDYVSQPSYNRPLGVTTKLILLAQAFNLHAVLALHAERSDLALNDVETTLKLDSGLRREPILVAGLVSLGVVAIQFGSIWEGLNLHLWNDAQLAKIQNDLKDIDFLSDEQLCLRGEALGFFGPTMSYLENHRFAAGQMVVTMKANLEDNPPGAARWVAWVAPAGWFDLGKSLAVTVLFKAVKEDVNPDFHRVFPENSDRIEEESEKLTPYLPWNFLPRLTLPVLLKTTPVYAEGQFRADAARIACMLERYRLAHGVYPASLDSLRAYDPDGSPHDIMNGEPYHYQLRSDGTYLLYSVGWNQTDEGGKPAYQPGSPKVLDRKNGDWVWPSAVKDSPPPH